MPESRVVHLPKLQTPERWAPQACNLEITSMRAANAEIRPGGGTPLGCVGPRRHVADTISRIEPLETWEFCATSLDCVYLEERNITPYNDVDDWIAINTTVYQSQRGAPFIFSGGRPGEILYVIDGLQVARW